MASYKQIIVTTYIAYFRYTPRNSHDAKDI